MQFYAFHGCFEEERMVGTHFSVDCTLHMDCRATIQYDDLSKTVNYQDVYSLIAQEMKQPSSILEHIAYRIVKQIHHQFPKVARVEIMVHKLNPQIGEKVGKVSVGLSTKDIFQRTIESE